MGNKHTLHKGLLICGIAGVIAIAGLSGCGAQRLVESAQRVTMTESDLQAEGREAHQQLVRNKYIYEDAALGDYVNRVGQRVVAAAQSANGGANSQLIFRFFVADDPDVNAFATPGGYVYITRGLLALLKNEDELAAVLGHETAHITAGHSLKQNQASARAGMLSALGSVGLSALGVLTFNPLLLGLASAANSAGAVGTAIYSQGFSRELELDADGQGKRFASLAGYNTGAAVSVLKTLELHAQYSSARAAARGIKERPSWGVLSSHPEGGVRIAALAKTGQTNARRAPEADYLAAIDGMVFGLSDRLGVQRGGVFYNRAHNLALNVPSGWFVSQSPNDQALLFLAPKNTARVALQAEDLSTRQDAAGYAKTYFNGGKVAGTARSIAGFQVWRGTVTSGREVYQAMTWTNADRGFVLIGARDSNSPIAATAWTGLFDSIANSLRPLRAGEQTLASAIRISVQPGKAGNTYAALAKGAPMGAEAVAALRDINGQYGSSAEPAASQRLKVLK